MADRRKKHDTKLAKIYADVKRNFTAADLQKFTEITPTVPFLTIVEEIEAAQTKHDRKSSSRLKRRKKTA